MHKFFLPKVEVTIGNILESLGIKDADIINSNKEYKKDLLITNTSDLSMATSGQISFFATKIYAQTASKTKASAVFVTEELVEYLPVSTIAIIVGNPLLKYNEVKNIFYPKPIAKPTIDKTAYISANATVDKTTEIRAFSVINSGAIIGKNTIICEHAVIGENVEIGDNCYIGINNVIENTMIGNGCIFHGNVTIGGRGFGVIPDNGNNIEVVHTGVVIIGENVEIGSNTAIDRATETVTSIGDNCKLDNLVHIAHNVKMGSGCIIAGQCGIAGGAIIGNEVKMSGQVGVSPAIVVGDGATVLAQGLVSRSVPKGQVYAGQPARPHKEWVIDTVLKHRKVEKNKNKILK